jgi:hypothetical protein
MLSDEFAFKLQRFNSCLDRLPSHFETSMING